MLSTPSDVLVDQLTLMKQSVRESILPKFKTSKINVNTIVNLVKISSSEDKIILVVSIQIHILAKHSFIIKMVCLLN